MRNDLLVWNSIVVSPNNVATVRVVSPSVPVKQVMIAIRKIRIRDEIIVQGILWIRLAMNFEMDSEIGIAIIAESNIVIRIVMRFTEESCVI